MHAGSRDMAFVDIRNEILATDTSIANLRNASLICIVTVQQLVPSRHFPYMFPNFQDPDHFKPRQL